MYKTVGICTFLGHHGQKIYVEKCRDFHSVKARDKHFMYKTVGISIVLGHGTNILCTKL